MTDAYKKIVVHGGSFHADDLLCVAFAKTLFPDIVVERAFQVTDEMKDDPYTLICDIGKEYDPSKQLYDHHNDCPKIPGTDNKKSAIGLMLDDVVVKETMSSLGYMINGDAIEIINIVQKVDNGEASLIERDSCLLSKVAGVLNPIWDSEQTVDEAFNDAVRIFQDTFVIHCISSDHITDDLLIKLEDIFKQRCTLYAESAKRAEAVVRTALNDMKESVVVLPVFAPWEEVLIDSDACFVVYPSNRGGYNLQCIPPEKGAFDKKIELPEWKDNAPDGMTFLHPARFIAAFDTEENAVNAAFRAVKEGRKNN